MHALRPVAVLFLLCWIALSASPVAALDVEISVSSVKIDFGLPHAPEYLLDQDPATAWVSGGIGPGVGQWMQLDFGVPVRVRKLGIFNGHQGAGQFQAHRRIRSGRIIYPDGTETEFWLRDEPGEQVIQCRGVPVKSLRIVVDRVFPEGELTGSMKLAVSELRLYLTLMEDPAAPRDRLVPDEPGQPVPPPENPDATVPEGIVELLREFYVRQTTLAPDYAELFAEDVRDRNEFRFYVFIEVQRQRGTYKDLRSAEVDTSGLGFEMLDREGDFAEVRAFGSYRVKVAHLDTTLQEDSTFVVSMEKDGWKIVELEGEEQGF